MAGRDYAKRAQTTHTPSKRRWWWLVLVAVGWLAWMLWQRPPQTPPPEPEEIVEIPKAPIKPRFEFYQVLPQTDTPSPSYQADEVPLYARADHEDGEFVLQIASFRRQADAQRVQSQLQAINIKTHIDRTDREGSVWYRLLTDTYTNRHLAELERAKLLKHRYKALLLKR